MADVKGALSNGKTNLVVITGGLRSILQPLDVVLKKPFKDRVWSSTMSGCWATIPRPLLAAYDVHHSGPFVAGNLFQKRWCSSLSTNAASATH